MKLFVRMLTALAIVCASTNFFACGKNKSVHSKFTIDIVFDAMSKGKFPNGFAHLQTIEARATEENPSEAYFHFVAGTYLAGGTIGALEYLDKSIAEDANYCDAYALRGMIKSQTGDHQGAIIDLEKLRESNAPKYKHENIFECRAISYLELKQYENAINECNAWIQVNPNSRTTYFIRGSASMFGGNLEQSRKDFETQKRLLMRAIRNSSSIPIKK